MILALLSAILSVASSALGHAPTGLLLAVLAAILALLAYREERSGPGPAARRDARRRNRR